MEYTEIETEMLEIYATFRLDGTSKEDALAYLIMAGYKPTLKVMEAIRTKDMFIFVFAQ